VRSAAHVLDANVRAFLDHEVRRVVPPSLIADDRVGQRRVGLLVELRERDVPLLRTTVDVVPQWVVTVAVVPHEHFAPRPPGSSVACGGLPVLRLDLFPRDDEGHPETAGDLDENPDPEEDVQRGENLEPAALDDKVRVRDARGRQSRNGEVEAVDDAPVAGERIGERADDTSTRPADSTRPKSSSRSAMRSARATRSAMRNAETTIPDSARRGPLLPPRVWRRERAVK
jgi:hypothetical protein